MERGKKAKKLITDAARRTKNFFLHLPLFAKFLVMMTSLILLSYLVLSTALILMLSNHWNKSEVVTLSDSARSNAQYCSRILTACETELDMQNAMVLIYNNIGITAQATDTNMFFCNSNGEIVICNDSFNNGISPTENMLCENHEGCKISDDILSAACDGGYVSEGSTLLRKKAAMAGSPVKIGNDTVAYVFAASTVNHRFEGYRQEVVNVYISSALFAALLSLLAVYVLTDKMTNPLRQMSNATKAYAKGDFSKRVDVKGRDEFADLCNSFNRMATALSVMETSRRSFVANVSHELKTPMTTIDGFINGMLDGTIPLEKRDEYLKIVSDEVQRLSRLVTSMLNLSKIEAGELELKNTDFNLNEMLINCLLTFTQIIEKKNIEIKGLDEIGKTVVRGDSDMIYQVLYNLIDNAVKFTPRDGSIEFSLKTQANGETHFYVENTGGGIPSEEIGRVFERFYKIDKSRSYDTKSAGLGLYLCKTIIEMHGGNIYVQSVEGKYTRFGFVLTKKIN